MIRQRHWRTQGGSLPLALLAAIIVAGLVTVLVARIVATQNQVRFDEGYHASLPVADAGVNLGKFWLNNQTELQATGDDPACDDGFYTPGDFPIGCSTPLETRTIDGNEYEFFLTRTGARTWDVTSTGTDARSGERRRVVATIDERPLVSIALFANEGIEFAGFNAADSYTSDPQVDTADAWCTGQGFVATNGVLDTDGVAGGTCHTQYGLQRTIDRGELHKWQGDNRDDDATDDNPGGFRCQHSGGGDPPANCTTLSEEDPEYLAPGIFEDELDFISEEQVEFMEHALAACRADDDYDYHEGTFAPGATLDREPFDPGDTKELDPPFEFPGDIDGPYHCFDSLNFTTHFELDDSATTKEPVIIVVDGDVTIKGEGGGPGDPAHVGCGGSECMAGGPDGKDVDGSGEDASRPEAGRLWIFTRGDVIMGPQGGGSAFAGVMWAPLGTCEGGAGVDIFGSLICGDHGSLGGWKFHFDEELAEVSSGEFFTASWREEFLD